MTKTKEKPAAGWKDLPDCPGLWLWTIGVDGHDSVTLALVRERDGVLVTTPYSIRSADPKADLRMWQIPTAHLWKTVRWYGPIPEDA